MAALSFKARFCRKVERGIKRQTIRNFRKVPIKMWEQLYFYYGLRTKHCRKIGEGQCIGTNVITIKHDSVTIHSHVHYSAPLTVGRITTHVNDLIITHIRALNRFARSDGFSSWEDMKQFWLEEHGPDCFPFKGTIIHWIPVRRKYWKKPSSPKLSAKEVTYA